MHRKELRGVAQACFCHGMMSGRVYAHIVLKYTASRAPFAFYALRLHHYGQQGMNCEAMAVCS